MHPVIDHVRTQSRPIRLLSVALIVLGLLVVAGCLLFRAPPLVSGLGFALAAGGGFSLWRLRRLERAFHSALRRPEKVLQLSRVNVTVTINGVRAGTHPTVVVVFDSGRHASLPASAFESLRSAFPSAAMVDDGSAFDRFDTRFRLEYTGYATASVVMGLVSAVALVTPSVNQQLARSARWLAHAKAERSLTTNASKELDPGVTSSWRDCGTVRLDAEVPIRLEGVGEEGLVGSLTAGDGVFLMEPFALPSSEGRASVTVELLTGSGPYKALEPVPPRFAIVGRRVNDGLALRVVTARGERVCEGLAPLERTTGNAVSSDEVASARVMVMRPFCSQLEPSACDGLPPPPSAPADSASGVLAREAISSVIKKDPSIRQCFELAVKNQRRLQGKVTVKFVIGTQGKVTSAAVQDTTVANAGLEGCVVARVRRFVFPKPTGGAVAVSYPFLFSQQ
ncbi:MAG: TonB family protein [Myxococcales bacterium]|nr:TonB family protein [Myxococcales bacterium]